jgi:hypothetical protein
MERLIRPRVGLDVVGKRKMPANHCMSFSDSSKIKFAWKFTPETPTGLRLHVSLFTPMDSLALTLTSWRSHIKYLFGDRKFQYNHRTQQIYYSLLTNLTVIQIRLIVTEHTSREQCRIRYPSAIICYLGCSALSYEVKGKAIPVTGRGGP